MRRPLGGIYPDAAFAADRRKSAREGLLAPHWCPLSRYGKSILGSEQHRQNRIRAPVAASGKATRRQHERRTDAARDPHERGYGRSRLEPLCARALRLQARQVREPDRTSHGAVRGHQRTARRHRHGVPHQGSAERHGQRSHPTIGGGATRSIRPGRRPRRTYGSSHAGPQTRVGAQIPTPRWSREGTAWSGCGRTSRQAPLVAVAGRRQLHRPPCRTRRRQGRTPARCPRETTARRTRRHRIDRLERHGSQSRWWLHGRAQRPTTRPARERNARRFRSRSPVSQVDASQRKPTRTRQQAGQTRSGACFIAAGTSYQSLRPPVIAVVG